MRPQTALTILHLSDTHLFGDGALHYGRVDTAASLNRALDQFSGVENLDLIVLSGDLSDDGSPQSYQKLQAAIEPWAAERHAPVIYAMGNHDSRTNFRTVLGNGHPTGRQTVAVTGTIDSVTEFGPWRIVTLDSSVPGAGYGELGHEQLGWLSEVLSTPADAGTILVIHHPPVAASTALLRALELYNADELLETLEGSDVRVILSGHYHHSLSERFGEFPVIVTPGIANSADVLAPEGTERAVIGAGGTLVVVTEAGVRATVLRVYGPDDGEQLFHLDAATVAEFVEQAGRVDTR